MRARTFWHPLRGAAVGAALVSVLGAQSEPPAQVVQQTLLQKLNMPTIYILVGCSMLIVWLVIDGLMRTRSVRIVPPAALAALTDCFRAGNYPEALVHCRANPAPFTAVLAAGLRTSGGGRALAEDAIASGILGENARFQNRIAYLSVIGVIAPMIGLVGTVLGMIDAFAAMGQAGAADPSKLSAAIGKVLYATAGGLVVAIPAFVFYYLLRNRTAHAMHVLQNAVIEMFRGFPFSELQGYQFSGNEPCAGLPSWLIKKEEPAGESAGRPEESR